MGSGEAGDVVGHHHLARRFALRRCRAYRCTGLARQRRGDEAPEGAITSRASRRRPEAGTRSIPNTKMPAGGRCLSHALRGL